MTRRWSCIVVAILCCFLAVSACSRATLLTGWKKAGASTQDFDRDHYVCYHDAQQEWNRSWSMFGGLATASSRVKEHYSLRMKGHGWTLQEQ